MRHATNSINTRGGIRPRCLWRLVRRGLGLDKKPTENKLTRSGSGLSRLLAISEEIDRIIKCDACGKIRPTHSTRVDRPTDGLWDTWSLCKCCRSLSIERIHPMLYDLPNVPGQTDAESGTSKTQ